MHKFFTVSLASFLSHGITVKCIGVGEVNRTSFAHEVSADEQFGWYPRLSTIFSPNYRLCWHWNPAMPLVGVSATDGTLPLLS